MKPMSAMFCGGDFINGLATWRKILSQAAQKDLRGEARNSHMADSL
jgi:hypothetical protein